MEYGLGLSQPFTLMYNNTSLYYDPLTFTKCWEMTTTTTTTTFTLFSIVNRYSNELQTSWGKCLWSRVGLANSLHIIACLILGEVDVELEVSILGPLTSALTQVWTGALLDTVA